MSVFIENSVNIPAFMLFSRNIPSSKYILENLNKLFCSRKYDGVRAALFDGKVITRNHLLIDGLHPNDLMPSNSKLPPNLIFDCEIIMKNAERSTHNNVMRRLNHREFQQLKVKIFDIVDLKKTFDERYKALQTLSKKGNFAKYIVCQKPLENFEAEYWWEGVIVRDADAMYEPGRRRNHSFKLKF